MKPPPLAYLRPDTVDEAVVALAELGDEAKVLAGGQSLVPMLNFRLARPSVLVDISRIPGLRVLERRDDVVSIGAAVRQREAESAPEVAASCPLIAQALHHVGHPQIRARGTVCGSLAHADPAAELGAASLVLEADMVIQGPAGERVVPATGFFRGPWTTALAADDVLSEVRIPVRPELRTTFVEVARRHGDFAVVGVAAAVLNDPASHALTDVRLAAIGVGYAPKRLPGAERVVLEGEPGEAAFRAAGEAAAAEVDPPSDGKGDAQYRRRLLSVLVYRALTAVVV